MITVKNSLNKLMILYLLNKSNYLLSQDQLSQFFVPDILTYFEFQNIVSDMIDTKLIDCKKNKISNKYEITEIGKSTFLALKDDIPPENVEQMKKYLNDNNIKFQSDSSLSANLTEGNNGKIKVNLEICDNQDILFNITMDYLDYNVASTICDKWKENAQEIYAYILKKLI